MSNVIMKIEKKGENFIEEIKKIVCLKRGITLEEMEHKTRKREIVISRQMAMTLAKEYTKASLAKIGSKIGGKDHATVLHAARTISNLTETDRFFRGEFHVIREMVEAAAGSFENSQYDMVCILCGKSDVQSKAWIDPNSNKFIEAIENVHLDPQDNWCRDCKANVQLLLRSEYDELNAPPPAPTEDQVFWDNKLKEIKNEFD